jgi:hypothetical protein
VTNQKNSSYDAEVESVSLVKRQADFPLNFREEQDVEITDTVTGTAPIPVLNVGVRQGGTLVDDELNVKPGTPLNMEVYLDSISKDVYGLMVTGMEVTDTGDQREPILVNGCSVDPYLFENFVTADGDHLRAKFRAFKFPESSFVLFRGTVNVCLDTCSGVQCSNGQLGFGRKKRSAAPALGGGGGDPNKVYQISMSTIIKMECEDCEKAAYMEKDTRLTGPVSSLRDKFQFQHQEDKALSALFDEFGSARYAYFDEPESSAGSIGRGGVWGLVVMVVMMIVTR